MDLYFHGISPVFQTTKCLTLSSRFKRYLKSVVLAWWLETQKWFMSFRVSPNQFGALRLPMLHPAFLHAHYSCTKGAHNVNILRFSL